MKLLLPKAQMLLAIMVWLLPFFTSAQQEPPFELPAPEDLQRLKSAIIYTEYGDMEFELFPEQAPWHVANLKYLADKNFYKGLTFHLVKTGYIVQGGDPTGSGMGGPNYSLPPEFNELKHSRGTLGMARSADFSNPARESHGSQFHILLSPAPHMDGQYTVFGELKRGEEILNRIRPGDKILDLKVFVRRKN